LAPVVVERPELGEESMRLLQVVPQDLGELERALPLGVHAVCPFDEAFVRLGTGALELAVVGRIPDQDVMEAEVRLTVDTRLGRVDELLAIERGEVRRKRLARALRREKMHGR